MRTTPAPSPGDEARGGTSPAPRLGIDFPWYENDPRRARACRLPRRARVRRAVHRGRRPGTGGRVRRGALAHRHRRPGYPAPRRRGLPVQWRERARRRRRGHRPGSRRRAARDRPRVRAQGPVPQRRGGRAARGREARPGDPQDLLEAEGGGRARTRGHTRALPRPRDARVVLRRRADPSARSSARASARRRS